MAAPIDLNALIAHPKTPDLTATIQSQLVAILDPALNAPGSSSSTTPDSVATDIDKLYRTEYSSDEKAEEFVYTLWNLYISIVRQIPVDDPRLPLLADVVVALKGKSSGTAKIWREDTKVWEDLPLLGASVRDAWNCEITKPNPPLVTECASLTPSAVEPVYDDSEKDNAAIPSWLTINSFAARLLGSSTTTWTNFAVWSLRSSLEQDGLVSQTAWDTAVAEAYEWITHAGKVLLDKSRQGEQLSEADQRMLKAGKLFGGEPGLNVERWAFWRQRLETFASGTQVSDAVKDKARRAAEEMKALEG